MCSLMPLQNRETASCADILHCTHDAHTPKPPYSECMEITAADTMLTHFNISV